MTHSNPRETIEVDEFDEVDEELLSMDMDSIPDPEDDYETVEEIKKTDKEIQIEQMEELLSSRKCNSWERGFCDSCLAYLRSKDTAQLSFKQKYVLEQTVKKYFDL